MTRRQVLTRDQRMKDSRPSSCDHQAARSWFGVTGAAERVSVPDVDTSVSGLNNHQVVDHLDTVDAGVVSVETGDTHHLSINIAPHSSLLLSHDTRLGPAEY